MTEVKGFPRGGFDPCAVRCHGRGARHQDSARANCVVRSSVLSPGQGAVARSASNALFPTSRVVRFRATQV